MLACKNLCLPFTLRHIFDDDDYSMNLVASYQRCDTSRLLHEREANLSGNGWERNQPAVQCRRNDIYFTLQRALQLGEKASFFKIRKKFREPAAEDRLGVHATVTFHPVVPTANPQIAIS